ncbi:SpaH/EbpB family LPXTG-anchored major pilin [Butyricicoccus intestinisimiae]|uniref:SpaH/EbpB family LPXTG-anchored major pilin n=1 Tax=Butyricicoccus intestinisimiae TaxID=2841509 RepID=A0ABS6ENT3_9FIRM|nr:SpaH/EbpB family LPXTG-anchored major pilin [Butyricicoccus intestinisimiae]MBU5489349.1 SpaH/EbpB family LPXTG-anchored major pilin [Butyricicoccus intestinisimiae]
MRKTIKRLGAVLLAMAMAVSVLCTGALAAETTYSITVNGKAGHTYQAYQIFTGTVSANGKTLSDIKWGTGVTPATLLSKLKENTAVSSYFKDITEADDNAEKIAEIIGKFKDSSQEAYAVADAVEASVTETLTSGTITDNATSTKITVSHAGYYLIKDANRSQDNNSETVYTRNILKIVEPNTTITTKDAVPSLKKTITGINTTVSDSENVEANTAGMGDKVNYKLTATVPDMSGYTSYTFKITDTMSKGLTFNKDVAITIDGTALEATDFEVSNVTTDDGNQTFTITIKDFINYKDNAGKNIIVTYSATLNEKADLSTAGNTNEAKITYSNDPNKPDSTGDTPTSKVKTYTTGLKLKKVANTAEGKTLNGAKFKISGTGSKVVLVNQTIYNKDDTTGTYYLLKNGTYTETIPTEENKNTYDSTTQKYKKIETVTKDTIPTNFETEAYVDTDGVLKIEGLGEGTYTITELVAPDGYNLLTKPITITISASNVTFNSCTWSIKNGDTDLNVDENDNTLYLLTVINNAGSTLPSTGGMGTKLFYTIGGILMAGAAIVLVVRKRRSDAE